MLTQKEFVEGCLNYYREADLQPGNPEDGEWNEAHYPVPKCKEGTETVLLLREHHAVQGVLQSEEFQWRCLFGWEEKFLSGELLELYTKWFREGVKLQWEAKTEEEKTLESEKKRAKLLAYHARMTVEEKTLRSEKQRVGALTRESRMTEEEKVLRAEKCRANALTQHARMTEEEKTLWSEKQRSSALTREARKRFEKEVDDLVAVWEMGLRWG
jgi:hypothetical protein